MIDIVCFELNNWTPGVDYPDCEPFKTWMGDDLNLKFADETWVKENKLCVKCACVDMSISFLITATKDWVRKNCPKLLEKEIYNEFVTCYPYPYFTVNNYSNFLLKENFTEEYLKNLKPSDLIGRPSGCTFLDWTEENFGVISVDDNDNIIKD